jgi:hypothetical protein
MGLKAERCEGVDRINLAQDMAFFINVYEPSVSVKCRFLGYLMNKLSKKESSSSWGIQFQRSYTTPTGVLIL